MSKKRTFKLVDVLKTTDNNIPEYSIFARYEGKEFKASTALAAKRKVSEWQADCEHKLIQALKAKFDSTGRAIHGPEFMDSPNLVLAIVEVTNE